MPRADVLFGAGRLGRQVAEALRADGTPALAFADDTPALAHTEIDGVPVLPVEEAIERHGGDARFVVTIASGAHRYLDSRERLLALGCADVGSFFEVGAEHPSLLPYYGVAPLEDATPFEAASELFADERSREELRAHIEFRSTRDYQRLPRRSPHTYFYPELVPRVDVYVDCGGYDGDTLVAFIDRQDGDFDRALVFEPDPANFERLRARVDALADARVELVNAAVGEEPGVLEFAAEGSEASRVEAGGGVRVQVQTLDAAVPDPGRILIKLDVEGAEAQALRGGRRLLAEKAPILAVSAYHKPDDLWQLPRLLKELQPGYELFLRTEGEDGFGIVIYAIPSSYQS